MRQTKTYKERYRLLFFLKSKKGVLKHIEYLVNNQVATGTSNWAYITRHKATIIVYANIAYYCGNPYTEDQDRVQLLLKIIDLKKYTV